MSRINNLRVDLPSDNNNNTVTTTTDTNNAAAAALSPYQDPNMDGVKDIKDSIIHISVFVGLALFAWIAVSRNHGFWGVLGYGIIGSWIGAGAGLAVSEAIPQRFTK